VIAYIQTVLVPHGTVKFGVWHFIAEAGSALYWEVTDVRTGKDFDVFVGDTITVTFSDGSSVQVKFLGAQQASLRWEIVPGSERGADGKPLAGSTYTTPVIPVAPGTVLPGFAGFPTLTVEPIQWCDLTIRDQCGSYIEWPNSIVVYCAIRTVRAPCGG
jgi:hypothetical protein